MVLRYWGHRLSAEQQRAAEKTSLRSTCASGRKYVRAAQSEHHLAPALPFLTLVCEIVAVSHSICSNVRWYRPYQWR
jgi:hypothetical protein